MKKVVCFGLCFLIVLTSFVICFASPSWPAYVPVSDSFDRSVWVQIGSDYDYYTVTSDSYSSPVWFAVGKDSSNSSSRSIVIFSDSPNTYVKVWGNTGNLITTISLSSQYNGYYYYSYNPTISDDNNFIVIDNLSPQSLIDYVNSSVFGVSFDISSLINGSVSWLSSMSQAVTSSGLLLFIVLFAFVGIGIGLFRRFTNG